MNNGQGHDVRTNLHDIERRILAARERSSCAASSVRILAVSKHQTLEVVQSYADLCLEKGEVPCVGENYVQALRDRRRSLSGGCSFHLIGHLQKNKVHDAVRDADLIESLDSIELAGILDREGEKQGKTVKVFVEVNISCDERKYGFSVDEAEEFILTAPRSLEHLKVCGLMTVLMWNESPEASRSYYAALRQFRDGLLPRVDCDHLELSMGMSHDFEIAVEEGATEVRIGTALFGVRG